MRTGIIAPGLASMDDAGDLLHAIHANSSGNELCVFTDKPVAISLPGDVRVHVTGSPIHHFLGRRWWMEVKLPAALKLYKPGVLLALGGETCSRTKIPQVLFIHDLRFLHEPQRFSAAERLYKKLSLPKHIEGAAAVITSAYHIKEELIRRFKTEEAKIHVLPPVINPLFKELDWEQSEQVKDNYSDGREFFLSSSNPGNPERLIKLLKAFSQFKKWQRSDMKLLIMGSVTDENVARLQTYKYRDDVVILSEVTMEQRAKLFASSYAFIHLPSYESDGACVIAAMKVGAPVIASNVTGVREVAGEAALYADADNEEMLATQMIRLHKDEMLRANLSGQGKMQAQKSESGPAIENLWRLIKTITEQKA